MGSFDVGPHEAHSATGADERVDDADASTSAVDGGTSGGLELTLVDIIGRGLLGRHYGVVYDPVPPLEPTTAPHGSAEPVIDLRTATPRRSRMLRARWRAFTTYWRGDLLSMIGDHFTLVALPLATNDLTHSAFKVGVVVSVETLATVLFGTMAGTFTDRRRPRPLMMVSDLIRAGILVLLAVFQATGHPNFAAFALAAFGLGALRLVSDGARSAFVADLVPDELDVRSNNRLVLAENVGLTVGPLTAGFIIAGGLWRAFGIDALSFACSALAIAFVGRIMRRDRIPERAPTGPDPHSRTSYRDESRQAIRAIRDDVVFRRALVVITIFNVTTLPIGGQFVTLATKQLHMETWLIGLMFAATGLAGILIAPLVERDHVIRPGAIPLATGTCGAAVLVVGIAPSIATVAVAFAVGGASFTFLLTHWQALRQRRFPVELQGRVTLTARRLMFSSILLGALAGGWLSDKVGPRALWLAAGSAGLLAAVWGVAVGLTRVRYD
jgi:MFS family permease